jgi:hypothetical protein
MSAKKKTQEEWRHMELEEWACLLIETDNKDKLIPCFERHLQHYYGEDIARYFRIHATLTGLGTVIFTVMGKLTLGADVKGGMQVLSSTVTIARMLQCMDATNYMLALEHADRSIARHAGSQYGGKYARDFKTRIQNTMSSYFNRIREGLEPSDTVLENFNAFESIRNL